MPGEERQLEEMVRSLRRSDRTIAMAGGCWDSLHGGHLNTLRFAHTKAEHLIVAMNSDASVRRLKGDDRPIFCQEDRAEMLMAIRWVFAVVIFDRNMPLDAIQIVKPDFYIKGGAYEPLDLPEAPLVAALGGQVAFAPMREGYSTTAFIERIVELERRKLLGG